MTSAFIGIAHTILGKKKFINYIYCKNGEPEGKGSLGETLSEHYWGDPNVFKVRALIGLGDVERVGPTLEETVAEHRDNGKPAEHTAYMEAFSIDDIDFGEASYLYLFENGEWVVYSVNRTMTGWIEFYG